MMRSRKTAIEDATLSRFLKQTRSALKQSAHFFDENRQNPLVLRRHFGSIQTTLGRFHEFQHLFTNDDDLLAANLIVSIGRWPAEWGAFDTWSLELEFSIKIYKKIGDAKLTSVAASLLAHLCSVSSAQGDLRLANQWAVLATKKAYLSEDALVIGQAVYVRMQILIKSANNKIIPILYQQAVQWIDNNISCNIDTRLLALAFLSVPYARFLNRNGELKRAIRLLTETIHSLPTQLGLSLEVRKELHDLRGVLYWVDENYQLALADFGILSSLLNHKDSIENFDHDQNEMDALLIPVLANRALVFNSLGKLQEAERMTAQAIELSRKINAFSVLMARIGDLSWNQLSRGRLKQALESTNEQLRMANMANDVDQKYLAIYNRASIIMFMGQAQEAYPDYLNLMSIFKRRKNYMIYGGLLIDFSICCWQLGDLKAAAKYYRQAHRFTTRHQLETLEIGILRLVVCQT